MLRRASETSTGEIFLARVDELLATRLKPSGRRVTDSAVSLQATGSPDALRNIRRSLRKGRACGVSSETVFKFAQALGTTPADLLRP